MALIIPVRGKTPKIGKKTYLAENESFETKNIKAAAARARKALGELGKLVKLRRAEIQEKKNSL